MAYRPRGGARGGTRRRTTVRRVRSRAAARPVRRARRAAPRAAAQTVRLVIETAPAGIGRVAGNDGLPFGMRQEASPRIPPFK